MQEIRILPFEGGGWKKKGYLVEDHIAIHANNEYVQLVEIEPAGEPGLYRPKRRFNFIKIASGRYSPEELPGIIQKLKETSVYDHITNHDVLDDDNAFVIDIKNTRRN